jgi:ABC-type transport system substrate-binding protein/class 3 adenylate cyclase
VTASTTEELRIVSVLMADVADSTAVAERLGPERSKILIDEVIRLMRAQILRYEGTVAQLTGDGLYAVFGAPVAHEDDSERAVRAALAIQRALSDYAEEVEAAYGVRIAVRIGVNTGPVLVGRDGGDELDYNALGDTVNVAARLQERAGPGEVALGPITARQVETAFELDPLGPLDLKGRTEPIDGFRVNCEREAELLLPDRPLVGRDFELTVLERVVDALVEGRGAIVSVIGEPGIGKSRLVAEVRKNYRDRVRFIEGRGVSYAQNFPYWPVRELLREWLGVGTTTPEARVRLELKAQLAAVFDGEGDAYYPFLASVLGLTLEPEAAERMRELNRESIHHQTLEAISELFCRVAADEPLCLVLEDLHWADESTLALLESLLGVTEEAGLALFFLYRSERDLDSWHLGERARQLYPHRYREIELRPLPNDASRSLAGAVADGALPESVSDLLTERAGGNPFFLEEALRDLIERGALERSNGGWTLAVGEDELSVPTVVQGALQARLDRLDPGTREVLALAAVIGRTFGMPLLERLLPHEELVPALSELQRLDLVVEGRRRPHAEYRFRHGLVQEVAYANLAESKRRRLHRRVGEALEDLYSESPEDSYALLARHFAEADATEKAVEYLLKAGDAARAMYADQEALEHYRKARAFLGRLGDEARARDTLFKMALAHHLAFDFEAAEELYDEAFCCRVDEPPKLPLTETLELAANRPRALAPGDVYSTDSMLFTEHLFRGLLMVDEALNVIPAMADNFRVSADGREYLFRLREGARWSDGVPLVAEDFAFAWRRMREEQTLTAFLMEDVEAAEAIDDRTIIVRLREPRSYFPYILCSPWSFPWPRHKCEELGDEWTLPENIVGNGPFMVSEWNDDGAVLVANPHWAGPRGNVRELRLSFVEPTDGPRLVEEWWEGRYDVLQAYDPRVREAPNTDSHVIGELSTFMLGFRGDRSPFSNELVRRAFAHAVDRERLLAGVWNWGTLAHRGGAIPPAMPGHGHRVGLEYDLDEARRLLAEAGYPGGRGLRELTLTVPEWVEHPEPFADHWRELGVRVKVRRVYKGHADADPEADFWMSGWTADYPDPDGFFRGLFGGEGWSFYRDDDVDELLTEARSVQNQGERMRLYHEIDRLWVSEQAAVVPLAYGRSILVQRPWVSGLWANPLSRAHFDQVVVDRTTPEASEQPQPDAEESVNAPPLGTGRSPASRPA